MPSDPVCRVLDRLEHVAVHTTGWTARCPAHGDTVNSLSIAEGSDGRALLHCHAGCTFEEVVAALGVPVRSLFVRRRRAG
jgi:putative DNA primase/helicase